MALAAPTALADAVDEVQQASFTLATAAKQLSEAETAKDRVSALTNTIQAYEAGLLAMRTGYRGVTIRERSLRLEFERRRDQISRLLGVLQTLERATTPLLLIHPTGPVGTARSGMMLSEITPGLQAQAENLRAEIAELHAVQTAQQTALDDIATGLAGLNAARVDLSKAIAQRGELPRRLVDDPQMLAKLVQNSKSLNAFAQSLSDSNLPVEATSIASFGVVRDQLLFPANSTVLRQFDEKDAAGLARPGLLLAAAPLSLVKAPWQSTVRYSGPFLDYGNVIILEPDPEYLIILAGLGQSYVSAGDIVNKDDPIGIIGGKALEIGDLLLEVTQAGDTLAQETLYLEIRKNKKPVDPIHWFKGSKG
ncbi:peptidase M23 [Amylibacter marinus]|uniref:Peptidase M23 n=1 Tax=Amylibacter marinus TaxID=1475483 RepID=A0ABQ5VWG5_9RHOB|nr:peptidoglycan DD-metalloendopeptidase family protein [Amylibacter marinus]GLQ35396.1 peptidase M23 [Amylibacter marinus]